MQGAKMNWPIGKVELVAAKLAAMKIFEDTANFEFENLEVWEGA